MYNVGTVYTECRQEWTPTTEHVIKGQVRVNSEQWTENSEQ